MVQHCEALNRSVQVVNLDPAAEHFNYPVMAGKSWQSLPSFRKLVLAVYLETEKLIIVVSYPGLSVNGMRLSVIW
jgi:hypothetical protein